MTSVNELQSNSSLNIKEERKENLLYRKHLFNKKNCMQLNYILKNGSSSNFFSPELGAHLGIIQTLRNTVFGENLPLPPPNCNGP